MKPLKIVWQRLVDRTGRTCDLCGTTQEALERAVATLKAALVAAAQALTPAGEAPAGLGKRDSCEPECCPPQELRV